MTALPALPNPRLSRAILLGTSEFPCSDDLLDLPAVRNNLTDLRASLTNPVHGVLAENNCLTVDNPRTPHEFMSRLRQTVRQVNDFLLVYYAGHGVRHRTRDDLYLTLRDTDTEVLNGTAVPLDWVKEEIEESPARTRLLILDCCYSGLAVGTMSASLEQRELEVRGSAVIASSPQNAKSHSPAGHRHTAFTGQLVTLLKDGSPNVGEPLTVMTLFHRINSALADADFPKPMIKTTGTTSQLLLRKEPARPVVPVEPSTLRLLTPVPLPSERRLTPVPPPPQHRLTPVSPPPERRLTPVPPPESRLAPVPPPVQPQPNMTLSSSSSQRDAAFWVRVVFLRLLWVGLALMLVMFLSSLFGVLFADPRAPGDGAGVAVGLTMSAMFGVPLFLLNREWGHLSRQTGFARVRAGRVLLYVAGALCLVFLLTALFSDTFEGSQTTSATTTRTACVLLSLEGVAACGYHLRRTPSRVT